MENVSVKVWSSCSEEKLLWSRSVNKHRKINFWILCVSVKALLYGSDVLIKRNFLKCTLVSIGASIQQIANLTCSCSCFYNDWLCIFQRVYVASNRQLKRLDGVTRSPIYSHFGETLQGATSIRAYGKQELFIRQSQNFVDANIQTFYPTMIATKWVIVNP